MKVFIIFVIMWNTCFSMVTAEYLVAKINKKEFSKLGVVFSDDFSEWVLTDQSVNDESKVAYVKHLKDQGLGSVYTKAIFLLHWELPFPPNYIGNFDLDEVTFEQVMLVPSVFSKDPEFFRARSSLSSLNDIKWEKLQTVFDKMSVSYKAAFCLLFLDEMDGAPPRLLDAMVRFCEIGRLYEGPVGAISNLFLWIRDEDSFSRDVYLKFVESEKVSEDIKALLVLWRERNLK